VAALEKMLKAKAPQTITLKLNTYLCWLDGVLKWHLVFNAASSLR
jgi:hypothetical protein